MTLVINASSQRCILA